MTRRDDRTGREDRTGRPDHRGGDGATPTDTRRRGRSERALRSVDDVAPTATPQLPERAESVPRHLVAELVDRFALADRYGAVARVRELRTEGYPDEVLRELLAAAVQHVGALWQNGHWTITQEHAATAVAEAVLTDLEGATSPVAPVGVVAVVAADGEWHALPARLAAHAFERAGLEVRYLGAGVPADDVARSLPAVGADVLAVSVTVTANLPGAARTVAAGHAAGLPVLVGGAAIDPLRADAIGADAHALTVDEGASLARRWCEQAMPPARTPGLRSELVAELVTHRQRLRDAAFAGTAGRWTPLEEADDHVLDRITEDLEIHLDHLVAALSIDDPSIYLDQVEWFRSVHAGRKLPRTVLTAQLDALGEAIGQLDPAAPDALDLVHLAAGAR